MNSLDARVGQRILYTSSEGTVTGTITRTEKVRGTIEIRVWVKWDLSAWRDPVPYESVPDFELLQNGLDIMLDLV